MMMVIMEMKERWMRRYWKKKERGKREKDEEKGRMKWREKGR